MFGYVRGELPDEESQNKGLSYEDTFNELPDDMKEAFADFSVKTNKDYDDNFAKEIEKARNEMSQVDNIINPINRAEQYDDFNEGEIPLSFFDELNS
jgi:spore coat polysaccharide biosynthesis protein SpsF (cytidylyltransferase family)